VTVQLVVSGFLLVAAGACTWCVAVLVTLQRRIVDRQVQLDRQAKQILRNGQRTQATADRILDKTYRFQSQVDVLLMDPKIQKALNRHEGGERP
jgi:hypothetical protein